MISSFWNSLEDNEYVNIYTRKANQLSNTKMIDGSSSFEAPVRKISIYPKLPSLCRIYFSTSEFTVKFHVCQLSSIANFPCDSYRPNALNLTISLLESPFKSHSVSLIVTQCSSNVEFSEEYIIGVAIVNKIKTTKKV